MPVRDYQRFSHYNMFTPVRSYQGFSHYNNMYTPVRGYKGFSHYNSLFTPVRDYQGFPHSNKLYSQISGCPSRAYCSHCSWTPLRASATLSEPVPVPPQSQTISLSVAKNTIKPTPTAISTARRSRTNPIGRLTLHPPCLLLPSEPMVKLTSLLYLEESVSSNRSDVIA